jgi:hypothetical protein
MPPSQPSKCGFFADTEDVVPSPLRAFRREMAHDHLIFGNGRTSFWDASLLEGSSASTSTSVSDNGSQSILDLIDQALAIVNQYPCSSDQAHRLSDARDSGSNDGSDDDDDDGLDDSTPVNNGISSTTRQPSISETSYLEVDDQEDSITGEWGKKDRCKQ